MELNLVSHKDPILKKETDKFDWSNPQVDLMDFATSLVLKMRQKRGLGLAAPQIGQSISIFCMEGNPAKIVINPKIIEYSKETVVLDEGCLSYPGVTVKVKRPRMIKARFFYPDGKAYTETFDGISARVFLHELDHLLGVCHLNRANSFHREQAFRKVKKMERIRKNLDNFIQV